LDAEDTVGTQVTVAHLAACPLGQEAHFEAELTGINGRRLEFRVKAWDSAGVIAEGTHERAIINVEKFVERLRSRGA
jgi:predicted thioesterase